MKKTNDLKKTCLLLLGAAVLTSCSTLTALTGIGGYGNTGGVGGIGGLGGVLTGGYVKGQYSVQLVECTGNASSQSVTAVITITNTGPNDRAYIGGSLDGTVAIDSNGATAKPYSSAGVMYNLPSGVVVRVAVEDIGPVRPGTPMFQSLQISIGSGRDNTVNLRNVPIVWTN
jgi:hypothetical protein